MYVLHSWEVCSDSQVLDIKVVGVCEGGNC